MSMHLRSWNVYPAFGPRLFAAEHVDCGDVIRRHIDRPWFNELYPQPFESYFIIEHSSNAVLTVSHLNGNIDVWF